MTISVTTVKQSSVGDGTANPVVVTIESWDSDELIIYEVVIATGVKTLLTDGVEYTLVLGVPLPAGATITPAAVRPITVRWDIYRVTPDTQTLDYVAQGTFPANSHEQGLDRAVARSQEHRWQQLRTMRLDETDVDRDMALPLEADRANFYAAYDANGQPAAIDPSTLTPTPVSLGAITQVLLPLATAALWRSNLGVPENVGDVDKLDAGTEAARAGTGAAAFGEGFWITTDTNQLWYSDGAAWTQLVIEQLTRAAIAATISGRIMLDTDRLELVYDNGATTPPIRTLPPNHLNGLTVSWIDATHLQVEPGSCRDSTDAGQGTLAAAISKLRNAAGAWTAGAAGNMIDVTAGSTLGINTWYYIFALMKPDGTMDWGIDDSPTAAFLMAGGAGAPTAGFTHFRRIGMIRTNAVAPGEFPEFAQDGDRFYWLVDRTARLQNGGVVDYSHAAGGADVALNWAPPGFFVEFSIEMIAGTADYMIIEPTDVTHDQPTSSHSMWECTAQNEPGQLWTRKFDASSQVHVRSGTQVNQNFEFVVEGWTDPRGKDL